MDKSNSWNKLGRIDLRCVKHIHELKSGHELEHFDVDWTELKSTLDLPRPAEIYLTRWMHDTDWYHLQPDDVLNVLVRKIFGRSNLAAKLVEDFDILNSVVAERFRTIQSRLLYNGLIKSERPRDPNWRMWLRKSPKFKVYWDRRQEVWVGGKADYYLKMSEDDLEDDSDARDVPTEAIVAEESRSAAEHSITKVSRYWSAFEVVLIRVELDAESTGDTNEKKIGHNILEQVFNNTNRKESQAYGSVAEEVGLQES
jgi:hypothetical protein